MSALTASPALPVTSWHHGPPATKVTAMSYSRVPQAPRPSSPLASHQGGCILAGSDLHSAAAEQQDGAGSGRRGEPPWFGCYEDGPADPVEGGLGQAAEQELWDGAAAA